MGRAAGSPRAEDAWRQLGELAARTRDASSLLLTHIWETAWAVLDGDLEGAVAAAARLPSYGDELGMPVTARQMAAAFGFRPRQHLNRLQEALAALPEAVAFAGATADRGLASLNSHARIALALASLGRSVEARALLEQMLAKLSAGSAVWQAPPQITIVLLEAAVLLGHREAAGRLATQLALAASSAFCGNALTCAAHHLGAAAALLGDREQAMRYYEQAIEVCGRLRFRPELALTHLGIAELLLDEGAMGRASGVGGEIGASLSPAAEGEGEGESRAPASTRAEALAHLDIAIVALCAMQNP